MSNYKEIAIYQKKMLYQLLATKMLLDKVPDDLETFISQTITEMEKEDVAYVREQVELRYGKK